MAGHGECPFCRIPAMQGSNPPAENRILVSTPSFFMVPALGPLSLGHVIVATKQHSEGLIYEPQDIVAEYRAFSAALRRAVSRRGDSLLEVEHGGLSSSGTGACVTHTHLHLLPFKAHLMDVFNDLPAFHESDRGSYLYLNDGAQQRIKDAASLPGQGVRRRIGEALGEHTWDWGAFPKYELVAATVEWWKGIL